MNGPIYIVFFLLSLSTGTMLSGQNTLTAEISNLRSNDGQIALELLDENEETVELRKEPISDLKCVLRFDSLAPGRYAIRYFHDENMNEELDKTWLGLPKEGYGFSNDAHGSFGPKKFEKWLVDVYQDTTIQIETAY